MTPPRQDQRIARGRRAHTSGIDAEATAARSLIADGWCVLARRVRTGAGELDLVVEKAGLLAIVEVKQRATLAGAAAAVSLRQQRRLMAATEALLAANPGWGMAGVRFDVLLVDRSGRVRRVADAFRQEG